jgi:hypothetical protein
MKIKQGQKLLCLEICTSGGRPNFEINVQYVTDVLQMISYICFCVQ